MEVWVDLLVDLLSACFVQGWRTKRRCTDSFDDGGDDIEIVNGYEAFLLKRIAEGAPRAGKGGGVKY